MKLLTNPLFSRAVVVFLCSAAAFVIGAVCMRLLKRGILESGEMPAGSTGEESLPLQAYTVIQELKQQKFALQNEQQQQRRRTKTSEHITAAIIANLPVGMLFIAPNGLVRQANAAARRILGFESLTGMSAAEIFRATKVFSHGGDEIKITDALDKTLRGDPQDEGLEGWYVTPRGEQRSLAVTLIPVRVPGGEILGLACVIADQAEAAALRQAQVMRAEESAELALELRTSLSTISEWAEQMKGLGDGRVRGLSEDISAEARRLEKVIGHFLTGNGQAKGAHA